MAGSASDECAKSSKGSKKRTASAIDCEKSLANSLQNLVEKKDAEIPLGDLRDLLMTHLLESDETDLSHTVILVCEEVPDLWKTQSMPSSHAINADDQSVAVTDAVDTKDYTPPSEDSIPFLSSIADEFQFYSKLSDGDSIPRCDSILLQVPVSKREIEQSKKAAKKAVKKKIKKFKKSTGENSKPSAEFYVLTAEELKVHLPFIPFDSDNATEFISTLPLPVGEARTSEQLLLALDCEMCRTTKGVELARLTLIDSTEKVLIDEYVRPKNPIVDYCTQYSGITFDIMENTTTTLAQIQQLFLQHVPAEAILVGHSIENDLQALKVLHRRVIDTTAIYPHPKGPPFRSALRFLASTYLKKSIQTGTDGHCSVEDAIATLQLVKLKIKHGPTFPSIEHEYKNKKVINELCQAKKSALIVDTQRACRSLSAGGAAYAIPCETNAKIISTVIHQLTTGFPPHFTWARMRGANRAEIEAALPSLKAGLPDRACLMVILVGETNELRDLHKLRTTRSDPRCSLLWGKDQQNRLDTVARKTQKALVHVFLK